MTSTEKRILFFLFVIILGLSLLLPGIDDGRIEFTIRVITFVNFILLFTSLICLKQFFWPGDINRTPFHVFNIFFTVIFYVASLGFLLAHRDYYDGYAHLTTVDVLRKFSMRWDLFSIMFWVIMFTMVINIIYVARHRTSYLQYN